MIFRKNLSVWIIAVSFSILFSNVYSQNDFILENDKGKFKQKFELANDLVIIPVEINGQEFSFLLDTGVNSTILFSLSIQDSSAIKDPRVVYLRGLGVGEPLRALKSQHNTVKIGDAVSQNHGIYVIEGGIFSISNRLGTAINGIIGYDFFKDFVIEFNYKRRFMKVCDPEKYEYRKCRRCIDLPIHFFQEKPYIQAEVYLENKESYPVDLLVDSGSSDALWLFEKPETGLIIPEESFADFLGFGITGSVYGDRSRIKGLALKKYRFDDITVSFPDSLSLAAVKSFEERDGSIGAQVFKRFHSVVDYQGENLRLKPNNDFNNPFDYNMSGVVVQHNGYRVIKSEDIPASRKKIKDNDQEGVEAYSTTRQVFYSLEPSYEVAEIRPDSPAELAGLKVGDEIIALNGRPVYRYDLEKITEVFSSKEGRKIKLDVLREGMELEIEFRLERIL